MKNEVRKRRRDKQVKLPIHGDINSFSISSFAPTGEVLINAYEFIENELLQRQSSRRRAFPLRLARNKVLKFKRKPKKPRFLIFTFNPKYKIMHGENMHYSSTCAKKKKKCNAGKLEIQSCRKGTKVRPHEKRRKKAFLYSDS